MISKKQLRMGIRIEREHRGTYNFIKHYFKTHHRMPTQREVYCHIAKNHLVEHKNYYTKLKKAKL